MIKTLEETEEFINNFIRICENDYDTTITRLQIITNIKIENNIDKLRSVVNSYIPKDMKKESPTIFSKSRKREIVNLKNIYAMLARDTGQQLKAIAKDMKCDHSTVMYRIDTGYTLLKIDNNFRNLYMKISKEVNPEMYPHARIIEYNKKISDNSRSAHPSVLYTGRYKIFKPSYDNRETSIRA